MLAMGLARLYIQGRMTPVRLLIFNIAHGRGIGPYQGFQSEKRIRARMQKMGEFLRDHNADIVAMQEVDEDSHWNKHINLLDVLRMESRMAYGILGANTRLENGPWRLIYGNAVISRHMICHSENHPFGAARVGEKGFQYVQVRAHGKVVPIINVHLDYRTARRRKAQVDRIIEFIESNRDPADDKLPLRPIICGDFNAASTRSSDAVSHLVSYLKSEFDYKLYPQKKGKTFPAFLPIRGIDHILVPSIYAVGSCRVIKSYLSDHRPVLLEFSFTG